MFILSNATATPALYTLSLHDALPISDKADMQIKIGFVFLDALALHRAVGIERDRRAALVGDAIGNREQIFAVDGEYLDRKSTRLNSSHPSISYAVFCLKKKTTN